MEQRVTIYAHDGLPPAEDLVSSINQMRLDLIEIAKNPLAFEFSKELMRITIFLEQYGSGAGDLALGIEAMAALSRGEYQETRTQIAENIILISELYANQKGVAQDVALELAAANLSTVVPGTGASRFSRRFCTLLASNFNQFTKLSTLKSISRLAQMESGKKIVATASINVQALNLSVDWDPKIREAAREAFGLTAPAAYPIKEIVSGSHPIEATKEYLERKTYHARRELTEFAIVGFLRGSQQAETVAMVLLQNHALSLRDLSEFKEQALEGRDADPQAVLEIAQRAQALIRLSKRYATNKPISEFIHEGRRARARATRKFLNSREGIRKLERLAYRQGPIKA